MVYRGNTKKIAYAGQLTDRPLVALLAIFYAMAVCRIWGGSYPETEVVQGLRRIWNPGIILMCQTLWIGIFLYMGRSRVTGARILFFIHKDRI